MNLATRLQEEQRDALQEFLEAEILRAYTQGMRDGMARGAGIVWTVELLNGVQDAAQRYLSERQS